MDVVVWLRSLGLWKYEAIFRENDIDETVLPSLTHENLKELGVASFGHRVKILDAIAALHNNGSLKPPSGAAAPARPSAATASLSVAEAVGERRHVTVMFCDLVGSTSISAGLDAEDWRDLVGAYLDAVTAAVTEFGGHVAKKLGDGLMALFGYPVAQENDTERAARAALSIQRALGEVNRNNADAAKPTLSARIGIETGPVVVDAAGEIYGDAPNTAARVQALAEPGTVVVTAQVQRQIAGLFVAEECGNHQLKGVPEPVTLFRLVRASGGGRRAGQRHLTPLVGRDEEIAMLMRRWERARQGDGQLVLIVGEPGLGKSRLVEEFHARLRDVHALIQDAAYENLLKSRRLILHRRVGETLRDQFAGTAEAEPELIAHHFTQAGMTEAAIEWWGKAGQRSVEHSALVEAVAQLTRALDQIGTLPSTPALRQEQIRLQVALITPLVHVKGYTAPETKAAIEQARLLIEQAEALGEPPEDPLLLFSVLFGVFVASVGAFDGDVLRDVTAHILELAERQTASFPRLIGHNFVAYSSMLSGELADGRAHYDPASHRQLATRFGEDQNVPSFAHRAWAAWLLGYPEAALCDADEALKSARATGQAATLMWALHFTAHPLTLCGHYSRASAHLQELGALAEKKAATFWTINRTLSQGFLFAVTGEPSNAVEMITSGIAARRATNYTHSMPWWLSQLAVAHVDLDQLGDAQRCIGEALDTIEKTKERWCEAEAYRLAGEIALMSPEPDAAKAEEYFERALSVARQQQAKSWELRASMSLARLWRDQGKVQ
jgi:class 3 adenylate cyclase/tetratricopeptide (TPR) repeat protein